MRHNLIQFLSLLTRIDGMFFIVTFKVLIYVMSGLVTSASHIDETPETVRHLPGDTGEPQGRC